MTPAINRVRLLERFLRYVRVATTANPASQSYPSSPGQLELGKMLEKELARLGLTDAYCDEHGVVAATIPATVPGPWIHVVLVAHLDTSPEAPGENVRPQVIERYEGGDIPIGRGEKVIRVADTPELASLVGKTLITTDGTTLLGGDDKAGVAILMELASHLIEHPHLPHGPIRVVFTCDEEIGRGTDKFSMDRHGGYVGYTLDGGGAGTIDVETFSADAATVTFIGNNIHPSIAKGRMVNAIRAAAEFVDRLGVHARSPESTDGREGFIHPYGISGGVGEAKLELILRSFNTEELASQAAHLQSLGQWVQSRWPGMQVVVATRPQYRNLADGLQRLPQAVQYAVQAFEELGRPYEKSIVRGGTDGSLLTAKGMPTPNLASGQHNIHSLLEFACLDEMIEACEHLVVLARLWQSQSVS
jgi:tripeptide aminopeptidase